MALSNRLRQLYQQLSANAPPGGRLYSQLALSNKGLTVSSGSQGTTSNMTATVFGSSSFLGRYLISNMARTGSRVVCPFRCDELDVQQLKVMGVLGQVVLYPDFNLRDDEMLDHAISKSNVVVNLVGAWRETWNYSFHDVHVDLTRRIAEAVKRAGHVERFLHVSCLAASPDSPSERLRTKAEGERIVRELLPNATIFKSAQMVGVEDKFTNALAARGKRSPFVAMVDGGYNKVQPVYVRDVARGMINSLKTYDAVGQTYHVAGPEVLTFREYARVVFETMREPYSPFELPYPVAKAIGQVADFVQRRAPPLPLVTPMAFSDFAAEMTVDHVVPQGDNVLTLDDLNVIPAPCTSGSAIEHIRHLRAGTTTKEMQWSQSLLFTPKLPMEGKAISDYLTPKATRSPSPAYRRERSISPGSFRRRSLTPASSFRETPPPPSDTLLDSPLPGAGLAPPATPLDDTLAPVLTEAVPPASTTRTGGQASLIPATALRQAEVTDGWVTVFGFQPQQLEIVLQEFQKCGDIEQFGTFGQGQNTNWVHIQFQNKYAAQRALQRSGLQLTSNLMIGVKPLDTTSRRAIQQALGGRGTSTSMVVQATLTHVRPYTLEKQTVLVPQAATSTWNKVTEFVFGL